MFNGSTQRTVRGEVFKQVRFARLSYGARWFLLCLRAHTDSDGNVDLDIDALAGLVTLEIEDVSPAVMHAWVDELIGQNLLDPYTVKGCRYAYIVGWDDKSSPLYQYVNPKDKPQWRNPTREEADEAQSEAPRKAVRRLLVRPPHSDRGRPLLKPLRHSQRVTADLSKLSMEKLKTMRENGELTTHKLIAEVNRRQSTGGK